MKTKCGSEQRVNEVRHPEHTKKKIQKRIEKNARVSCGYEKENREKKNNGKLLGLRIHESNCIIFLGKKNFGSCMM